jgi:hypothetical protein
MKSRPGLALMQETRRHSRMTEHKSMHTVSRLEVIQTGARRRWTVEEKRRIVAESDSGVRQVSATARGYGMLICSPGGGWHARKLRRGCRARVACRSGHCGWRSGHCGAAALSRRRFWLRVFASKPCLTRGMVASSVSCCESAWQARARRSRRATVTSAVVRNISSRSLNFMNEIGARPLRSGRRALTSTDIGLLVAHQI